MLENELWGNTIENWGISILIILGAIIIVNNHKDIYKMKTSSK